METTFYGYCCEECRNTCWLADSPEKFITCPHCEAKDQTNNEGYLVVKILRTSNDES